MRRRSKSAAVLAAAAAAGWLAVLRVLPRRGGRALGRALGRLAYALDRRHRRLAASNIASALGPRLTLEQRERLVRDVFLHFGTVFCDFFHLATRESHERKRFLRMTGAPHLEAALRKGKGVLLFTGHYGLWEAAPALINPIVPLKVVARPLDNPFLEGKLHELRGRLGSGVISKYSAGREILKALRRNQAVAILIDQNVLRQEAVFVDFFGRPAATTPSLALFHLRTGAPILPVFCRPETGSRYHVAIGPPVEVEPSGDRDKDVVRITQACTSLIEDRIREEPRFWFWFHDRWKTRPAAEGSGCEF
jgi:KDO2-lipid IV(A) lauroyltransferase